MKILFQDDELQVISGTLNFSIDQNKTVLVNCQTTCSIQDLEFSIEVLKMIAHCLDRDLQLEDIALNLHKR